MLIQNLSDDQLLQLEATGKAYSEAIAAIEKERTSLVQEHLNLLMEESSAQADMSEKAATNLSERKEANNFKLFLTVYQKFGLETNFYLSIKDILNEQQWKYLSQVPSRRAEELFPWVEYGHSF